MARILFVGNFLSRIRGTVNPTERIVQKLDSKGLKCLSVSHYENRIFRLLHILVFSLFARYDKMHVDTFSNRSFRFASLATSIARWRGKPVILNLHGGKLPEYYNQYKERVSSTFRRATLLVSPSQYLVDYFSSEGYKVQYLPNFIDLQRFKFAKTIQPNHAILWVRAFTAIYQPQVAIATLALLKEKYPDATLSMAGPDRGLRLECEEQAKALEIESSVHFLGAVPNKHLPELYNGHGIFLNTTTYESFGMALMEAAACGIPIVSSNVGEIPILWENGKDIMLAHDLQPESYATAVAHLFENPAIAIMQSAAARQKAETFDWKVVEKQWLDLLNNTP